VHILPFWRAQTKPRGSARGDLATYGMAETVETSPRPEERQIWGRLKV